MGFLYVFNFYVQNRDIHRVYTHTHTHHTYAMILYIYRYIYIFGIGIMRFSFGTMQSLKFSF